MVRRKMLALQRWPENRNAPAKPRRSSQQRYCTTRVIKVKLKNWGNERKVKTRSLKTEGCGTRLEMLQGFTTERERRRIVAGQAILALFVGDVG
jgi:hypothetical protein